MRIRRASVCCRQGRDSPPLTTLEKCLVDNSEGHKDYGKSHRIFVQREQSKQAEGEMLGTVVVMACSACPPVYRVFDAKAELIQGVHDLSTAESH